MLINEIKTHPHAMPCPPKEHELDPTKLSKYILDLLDRFCSVLRGLYVLRILLPRIWFIQCPMGILRLLRVFSSPQL